MTAEVVSTFRILRWNPSTEIMRRAREKKLKILFYGSLNDILISLICIIA